jgi:hypothetical protein
VPHIYDTRIKRIWNPHSFCIEIQALIDFLCSSKIDHQRRSPRSGRKGGRPFTKCIRWRGFPLYDGLNSLWLVGLNPANLLSKKRSAPDSLTAMRCSPALVPILCRQSSRRVRTTDNFSPMCCEVDYPS